MTTLASFHVIIFLLLMYGKISHSSVFNCDSQSLCSSVNHCVSNELCLINCDGNHACQDKTFHCPSAAQCIINCGTNQYQQYSCHQTLFTTKSDTEIINITTKGIHSMAYSTIFCPTNTMPGFTRNCFIYSLEGKSQISNINIYAAGSYHDIYIHCNHNNCYDPLHYPTMYCSDYTPSCNLRLRSTSLNTWQCTINTTICNTISFTDNVPTIKPTLIPTLIPTPSFISTELFEFVDDSSILSKRNDAAILVGGILGAAFCCSFVLLFVVAAYLIKSKAEKFTSLSVRIVSKKERQRLESRTDTVSTDTRNSVSVKSSKFARQSKATKLKVKPQYSNLRQIQEHKEEKYDYDENVKGRTPTIDESLSTVGILADNTERDNLNELIVERQSQYIKSKIPRNFSSNQLTQCDFDEIAQSLKE